MALFQALNEEGVTIVVVTHEPEIAAYASRIVEVRDGRIVRDESVKAPRSAAQDAARMAREESEAPRDAARDAWMAREESEAPRDAARDAWMAREESEAPRDAAQDSAVMRDEELRGAA
jgi:ABC-type multidrug transport system ATPase subunit